MLPRGHDHLDLGQGPQCLGVVGLHTDDSANISRLGILELLL